MVPGLYGKPDLANMEHPGPWENEIGRLEEYDEHPNQKTSMTLSTDDLFDSLVENAIDFFRHRQTDAAAAGGPPPLGIHILMGETAQVKIRNMVENIVENRVSPVELIAEKP